MLIFGFPIGEIDKWTEDPSGILAPENMICEACHIYQDIEGFKYIGFDVNLGLSMDEMREYLSSFSSDLYVRKVELE